MWLGSTPPNCQKPSLGFSKASLAVLSDPVKIIFFNNDPDNLSRRPGDVASCYASSTLAERELGFKAEKSLTDMCELASSFRSCHHHQQPWPPHQIVNRILFKILCKCWHWSLPGRDMWTWQSKNPHGFSTPDKSWSQLTSKQDNTWDLLSLQQQNLSHMSYIHTGHKTFKVLLGVLKCCAFCHIPQTKEVFI